MTTGLDIIQAAMRKIGVLTKTESPSSDEADDALETLNNMVDSWINESIVVYSRTLDSKVLTGGDGEYTIGSGGDINTTKPVRIISAYVRIDTTDYPLEIISDENYAKISTKSSQSIPKYLNYTNGHPLGTIKLYGVPAGAYTLYLLSEKPFTSMTLAGTVDLPAGWKKALIDNLAVELSSEYGQEVTQAMMMAARESRGAIKSAVMRNRSIDAPLGYSTNSIYTGYWDR